MDDQEITITDIDAGDLDAVEHLFREHASHNVVNDVAVDDIDMNLTVDAREITRPGHYHNLKGIVLRTAKKFANINFSMRCLVDDKTEHTAAHHIIIKITANHPYSEKLETRLIEELLKVFVAIEPEIEVYCATVVSKENEPGKYILPCLHVLCQLPIAAKGRDFIIEIINRKLIQ